MLTGLDTFRTYFAGYENQYVIIGGAACNILFESNDIEFRTTRDFDMVLIVEALTPEFGQKFWEFIKSGKYRNKYTNGDKPQVYRFDKPENQLYPKMIELFCRNEFELREMNGITPVYIDEDVSSLSAIILNDDYYQVLIDGRTIIDGICVLRPEYLILFKAKAFLDLKSKKEHTGLGDSSDIKKHKKDILRIVAELKLSEISNLSESVKKDIRTFIELLVIDPFEDNSLKNYGLANNDIIDALRRIFDISARDNKTADKAIDALRELSNDAIKNGTS